MRGLIITIVTLAALVQPARAQRIEVQKPDPNRIVRVQTALNHLTVIEVREPVITVAAGSPAFKIEWRENKVFIQPTEADVATNLFIWTASGRTSYELEPAGAVDEMHFAIDEPAPPPVPAPTDRRKAIFAGCNWCECFGGSAQQQTDPNGWFEDTKESGHRAAQGHLPG